MQSPKQEQNICLTCGLCCDGTLFFNAVLKKGEKGNLPQKMEEAYVKNKNGEFFELPCAYFNGKCSIYDKKKAHVCSSFRCNLLKEYSSDSVNKEDALSIVQNAQKLREEVLALSESLFGKEEKLYFRKILMKIEDLEKNPDPKIMETHDFKILKIKALILETLLTKHFKSKENFDKMIIKD